MNTPKDAIQEALNPWADVDIPTIDNTPLPEILNKVAEEPIVNKNKPFVLISYAWEVEDNVFMNWIQTFAKDLRRRGIDAQIDQYQPHGTDLPKFMLESIRKATKVLCILTPKYKEKAESGKGGAAYEGGIIHMKYITIREPLNLYRLYAKGLLKLRHRISLVEEKVLIALLTINTIANFRILSR